MTSKVHSDIAIIAVSCLVPGSKTPDDFFQSLLQKKNFIGDSSLPEITENDFQGTRVPQEYGKLDNTFLRVLYIVHQALKQSGYLNQKPVLNKTGIILGTREGCLPKMASLFTPAYLHELENQIAGHLAEPAFKFDYSWEQDQNSPLNAFSFSYPTLLAAETLGMKGPTYCLDAACASSLYGIKLASYYLANGQADLMLAGGFSSGFELQALRDYFAKLGVAAEKNKSTPLDRSSKGMVAQDGGGLVVLKRLEDAIRDNDNILGVIESISWRSQAGKGKMILAPSKSGQAKTYKDAFDQLANKGITPNDIDYIECHATGTPVGDTIELNTLEGFYGAQGATPKYGSVKGNIGHLMSGAGIVALIKILYSMKTGTLPATYGIKKPLASRKGTFGKTNLVCENLKWDDIATSAHRKRAAVSCFGFGGSHAHLLISDYRSDDHPTHSTAKTANAQAANKPVGKDTAGLNLVGCGVQVGSISGPRALQEYLTTSKSVSYKTNPRLRGLEHNHTLTQQFLPPETFAPGIHCSQLSVDFMKSALNTQSRGEILNKELMILEVVDQALEQAGYHNGDHQNTGVVVATRQSLFQVQMFVEYYLPQWIDQALEKNRIHLDKKQKNQLLQKAQHAILGANNEGFDFIATSIGPIVANRISAIHGFTGPSIKMDCLENSLFRALEMADQMLHFQQCDSVVVAVADSDPALESRILLSKYAKDLNLDIQSRLIDDSAVALVVTTKAYAETLGRQPISTIDRIECSLTPNQATSADKQGQDSPVESCGSQSQDLIEDRLGFSFATAPALAMVKTLLLDSSYNARPILFEGNFFDGQQGRMHITPVSASVFKDATQKTQSVDNLKPDTGKLIKNVSHRLQPISSEFPTLETQIPEHIPKQDSKQNSKQDPDLSTLVTDNHSEVIPLPQPVSQPNLPAESLYAQLYQQNCRLQCAYYENQRLLNTLINAQLDLSIPVENVNNQSQSSTLEKDPQQENQRLFQSLGNTHS